VKTVTRVLSSVAGLALAFGVAQTSHAVVLLSDNFDADSAVTVTNFDSFINWTVDSGTMDYLRSGAIACVGGTGGCVDSDGSSLDAGRLVSRATFAPPALTPFTISLDVSGSQRSRTFGFPSPPDQLDVGLVDATTLASIVFTTCTRLFSDPYSNCGFGAPAPAVPFKAFIAGFGGDFVGAVFDNFVLDVQIAQMPEPGGLALLAIGLAGLGLARRRKR
jgi:hypothetical protein